VHTAYRAVCSELWVLAWDGANTKIPLVNPSRPSASWNSHRPPRDPSTYTAKDSHSWNSLTSRNQCQQRKLLIQAPSSRLVLHDQLFMKFMKIRRVPTPGTARSWAPRYDRPLPASAHTQNYTRQHARMSAAPDLRLLLATSKLSKLQKS